MAEGGKGIEKGGSEMELEAGEIVPDVEMPGLSGDTRSGEVEKRGGSNVVVGVGDGVRRRKKEEEEEEEEEDGEISLRAGEDVLLAAQAAEVPVNGNGNGVKKGLGKTEEEEESEEEEEEDDDGNAGGMVEEDSSPLGESDESSEDESEEEDGDVNAGDLEKSHIQGEVQLEKMVQRVKGGGDSDEEEDDGASEPPRTANEVTDLPLVPEIEAVLNPHQVPHQVGVVSSILDTKVIVEAVEHEMVLNEGSILWLTEHRKPLGIVDEVFGPVKKPYYVVRYNKAADVPDVTSQGVTVGFVQEFASFVLNDNPDLRKKGYDASGNHDEEVTDDEEFSDDEKEEEAKRRILAAKQKQDAGDMGRGGGRGDRGGRHKVGGRNGGRGGRGGGRGRFSRSDSAKMLEVDDTLKARAAGMGHQRSNSLGSPVFSRDKGLGGEHHRGQFHPSPDRQNSWNRSPRSDITYSQVPDLRPPMVNYNERQSLPYQSAHHDFVPGVRPLQQQQPPHLSPQRSPGPPHWGISSGPLHGEVHQVQHAPYLGSGLRWPHQPTGDYQHPEGMYQARVNLVPMASYPLPQQMSMYAPPPQPVGTGVFIPPAQYSRSSQGAGHQMHQTQGAGPMLPGSVVHPAADGRGGGGPAAAAAAAAAGQWPVNGPSIVTGIPCYSSPAPQAVFLQPGQIRPGMIAPGPNSNVYWTNNFTGR